MVFNNATAGYTVAGTANTTITFDTTANLNGITVLAGTHTVTAPIRSLDDTIIDVAASSKLHLVGAATFADNAASINLGRNLTKSGTGTLQVLSIQNTKPVGFDGTSTVAINAGRVVVSQSAIGDTVGTSKVNALTIASGAVLDLTNNSMIIDYPAGNLGSLLTDVKAMLASGRMTTSVVPPAGKDLRLGYRDNNDISPMGNAVPFSNFAGLGVDASSLLIKYTYGGDTNLDGAVDIKDLFNLALNYDPTHAAPGKIWDDGDFDYNGFVDVADLTLLALDWKASGDLSGSSLSAALAAFGLPDVAVPEPTSAGLVGLGLAGLLARRRRNRKA
jgi:hypothetical protein